jgi:hypothetical protein
MEEIGSNKASQQSTYHADDDVTDTPVTAPFYDQPGQSTREQANDNPGEYSHFDPHFFLYCFSVMVMRWIFVFRRCVIKKFECSRRGE